ncbi:uncharacterized protein GLRG_11819 [Colletotrichum graminicola M1.001]|uniref:Uncharacterized protein n=1 Tax=Colletotrichum graminicola (strain M1.001 / M2 / FGSC 10212) TaxID=645133 RepID=E3R0N5_COLGM|nr:uncharacterized protein GLRG_11819 [Colletotrichum graminicola M1.001]EFQ36673.1 hypothetical protein GLRG_11819 [Colletotrichum graminicola M1.001]
MATPIVSEAISRQHGGSESGLFISCPEDCERKLPADLGQVPIKICHILPQRVSLHLRLVKFKLLSHFSSPFSAVCPVISPASCSGLIVTSHRDQTQQQGMGG